MKNENKIVLKRDAVFLRLSELDQMFLDWVEGRGRELTLDELSERMMLQRIVRKNTCPVCKKLVNDSAIIYADQKWHRECFKKVMFKCLTCTWLRLTNYYCDEIRAVIPDPLNTYCELYSPRREKYYELDKVDLE